MGSRQGGTHGLRTSCLTLLRKAAGSKLCTGSWPGALRALSPSSEPQVYRCTCGIVCNELALHNSGILHHRSLSDFVAPAGAVAGLETLKTTGHFFKGFLFLGGSRKTDLSSFERQKIDNEFLVSVKLSGPPSSRQ